MDNLLVGMNLFIKKNKTEVEFDVPNNCNLKEYCNLANTNDLKIRRSTTGYTFYLGIYLIFYWTKL